MDKFRKYNQHGNASILNCRIQRGIIRRCNKCCIKLYLWLRCNESQLMLQKVFVLLLEFATHWIFPIEVFHGNMIIEIYFGIYIVLLLQFSSFIVFGSRFQLKVNIPFKIKCFLRHVVIFLMFKFYFCRVNLLSNQSGFQVFISLSITCLYASLCLTWLCTFGFLVLVDHMIVWMILWLHEWILSELQSRCRKFKRSHWYGRW